MLYRKMRNKFMKHQSKVLPTRTGGDGNYMCYDERNEGTVSREAWSDGSTYKERTTGVKGKTTDGQEEDMGGNEKWELDGQKSVLPITY
jgi:hypothetical protein